MRVSDSATCLGDVAFLEGVANADALLRAAGWTVQFRAADEAQARFWCRRRHLGRAVRSVGAVVVNGLQRQGIRSA